MYKREITIIPATINKAESRYHKVPGKLCVLGYSRVIKGSGAGVQIRKNIRRVIADHTDWELIEVSSDYCQMENQKVTWKKLFKNIAGLVVIRWNSPALWERAGKYTPLMCLKSPFRKLKKD